MKTLREMALTNGRGVSADGYIRILRAELGVLPLTHLLSDLDEEVVSSVREEAAPAVISGYTEWLSLTTPVVTVGWDWRLDVAEGAPRYVIDGWPRTNAMLIEGGTHRDLGAEATAQALVARVEQLNWMREVAEHISAIRSHAGNRYEGH